MARISVVKSVRVHAVSNASYFQVGDSISLCPQANVLAVARQVPIFSENEGDLSQFNIYFDPIPIPSINEDINVTITNESPIIQTGHIKVLGISASAIMQIGSNAHIRAESRVMHIRHFLIPPENLNHLQKKDSPS